MKTKKDFKEYLQSKQMTNSTIETYERLTEQFLQWAEEENLQAQQSRYNDILAYMKYCSNQKGYSQRTVQHNIIALGHYFDHLNEEGIVMNNPVKGIQVRGVKRRTLYHILQPEELDNIYQTFEANTISQKKNKIIVGLMVYQGLKKGELERLEVRHVKLKEAKVQVTGSRKSNGRILSLEPHQVLELNEYLQLIRTEIISKTNQMTDKLFVSVEGGNKLRLDFLMQVLRKQNSKIQNIDQIRASVIVKWLKMYNLRQVQYIAGHRFISSTEAYLQNDTEGLSEEVNQFHPLG